MSSESGMFDEKSGSNRDFWVVIAAFNEGAVIRDVVAGVAAIYPNVVVVDDGSSDETSHQAALGGAVVVRHPINLGQGAALQTGISFALGRGAEAIATFDADGQHRVSDLEVMRSALELSGADVALGSRFAGESVGMPLSRRLLLKAAVAFTYMSTGLSLTDTHNGLRLLRRSAAEKIQIRQNRMAHASEILEQIARLKIQYVEVPVQIHYTEYSMRKGQRITGAFNILTDLYLGKLVK